MRPLSHTTSVTVSLLLTIIAGVAWTIITVTSSHGQIEKIEALLQTQEKRIDRLEARVFSFDPALTK